MIDDEDWMREAQKLKEQYDREAREYWERVDSSAETREKLQELEDRYKEALEKTREVKSENDSAFDAKNFQPVVLIQLMRLYDVQLAMLSMMSEEKAEILRAMHERGQTFCPPPAFVEYEENDEQ